MMGGNVTRPVVRDMISRRKASSHVGQADAEDEAALDAEGTDRQADTTVRTYGHDFATTDSADLSKE